MCGIAGVFSKKGEDYFEKVVQMTDALAHRGPDAHGFFEDGHCFLGHRRLSVLDTSESANQPFFSNCKKYVIIYNGEVYNFKELAKRFKINTQTRSDTEVILELFIKNGPSFVADLNGMFAIAIYNREEKNIFIYRDRIGIKPIYYINNDAYFAFASELKSFKKLLDTQIKIDQEAIADYLYLGYIPEPKTIFQNVHKFPSGCSALLSKNKFELSRYWNPATKIKKEITSKEKKAKEDLKQLIQSSINYRMISDVPLGTFLSGGTDSSLVTAMAQEVLDKPVKTFSIGFKESKFNESVHAKSIAKHLQTDHYEYILSESMAQESVSKLTKMYDEPFADSSSIPTQLISKMAKKEVTVALSGDGGDELFMGYGMYQWANRLANPVIKTFRKPISLLLSYGGNREKRASKLFQYKDSNRIKSHIFSQEQYFFSLDEINELLIAKSGISLDETNYGKLSRSLKPDETQAFFDLNHYLKDDLLVKVDRASMAHSLEVRVPLLDHRIVEYALNLDRSLKVKGSVSKYLLKETLYDYIPAKLLDRPKRGFSIPLATWLQNDLKYLIDTYLSKEVTELHNVLNYDMVDLLKRDFFNGDLFLFNRIWAIIILHKWLEEFNNDKK